MCHNNKHPTNRGLILSSTVIDKLNSTRGVMFYLNGISANPLATLLL